jgi:tripartite-type tricarboxylate transporter receptor subunit TctC
MMAEPARWFTDALQAPALKAKLAAQGFSPVGRCRADFAALLASKYDDYGRVFREVHIAAE